MEAMVESGAIRGNTTKVEDGNTGRGKDAHVEGLGGIPDPVGPPFHMDTRDVKGNEVHSGSTWILLPHVWNSTLAYISTMRASTWTFSSRAGTG